MKRTAEAALRNRAAIADALRDVLPANGVVLEVGSGTGEHAVYLARLFPGLLFQPSDPDPLARASIRAWADEARLGNLRGPLDLDIRSTSFPLRRADAILCVNVLHVTRPEVEHALLRGAAQVLSPGGPLIVYGPFTRGSLPLTGRLRRLQLKLTQNDPSFGVRDEDLLEKKASLFGLVLERSLVMPEEGDVLLFFRKEGAPLPNVKG